MELRNYPVILWRRKWVIAVTFAVTVGVVVAGTLMASPTYSASTTPRVLTPTTGSVEWRQYDSLRAERLLNTYTETATSGPVLDELVQRLGVDEPSQIG
jgi:uncharacterized protein involved in exopolysaccharide biosynthesis